MMAICLTPQDCVGDAVDSFWGGLADMVKTAAGQMVTTLFGWWTTTPALNLNTAVVHTTQNYVTAWIAVPVAVLAVLAAVGGGVLGGGTSWLADIPRGLIMFGVTAAGSIPVVAALQTWSTELAKGLLSAVPTKDVGDRITHLLDLPTASSLIVAFWASVLLLSAAIQYLMMLFRDGAILVLTAVLPLAAAGQFSRGSVFWLPKVTGWLLAFFFVMPAAALIYYLGLTLIGQANGVQALASGVCMMIAAIFALPAMLSLVTFAVNAAPMGSGAALGTLGTASSIGVAGAQMAGRSGQAAATTAVGAAAALPAGAAIGAASSVSSAFTTSVTFGKDGQ